MCVTEYDTNMCVIVYDTDMCVTEYDMCVEGHTWQLIMMKVSCVLQNQARRVPERPDSRQHTTAHQQTLGGKSPT